MIVSESATAKCFRELFFLISCWVKTVAVRSFNDLGHLLSSINTLCEIVVMTRKKIQRFLKIIYRVGTQIALTCYAFCENSAIL
jgi:hypothetical protein